MVHVKRCAASDVSNRRVPVRLPAAQTVALFPTRLGGFRRSPIFWLKAPKQRRESEDCRARTGVRTRNDGWSMVCERQAHRSAMRLALQRHRKAVIASQAKRGAAIYIFRRCRPSCRFVFFYQVLVTKKVRRFSLTVRRLSYILPLDVGSGESE